MGVFSYSVWGPLKLSDHLDDKALCQRLPSLRLLRWVEWNEQFRTGLGKMMFTSLVILWHNHPTRPETCLNSGMIQLWLRMSPYLIIFDCRSGWLIHTVMDWLPISSEVEIKQSVLFRIGTAFELNWSRPGFFSWDSSEEFRACDMLVSTGLASSRSRSCSVQEVLQFNCKHGSASRNWDGSSVSQ